MRFILKKKIYLSYMLTCLIRLLVKPFLIVTNKVKQQQTRECLFTGDIFYSRVIITCHLIVTHSLEVVQECLITGDTFYSRVIIAPVT